MSNNLEIKILTVNGLQGCYECIVKLDSSKNDK